MIIVPAQTKFIHGKTIAFIIIKSPEVSLSAVSIVNFLVTGSTAVNLKRKFASSTTDSNCAT